jgi:hypothetical protein
MADRTAYFAEYWSRPEVIAANRAKSKRVAEKKKLKITARRLTEHSLDDLLEIAKKKCEEKNLKKFSRFSNKIFINSNPVLKINYW